MKSYPILIYITLFLLFVQFAGAAELHGTVYDIGLNKIKEAQLTINTVPVQRQITQDGNYAFPLPVGTYTLTADYYQNNILKSSVKEKILIKEEGSYVYDLILFPVIGEDINVEEDLNLSDKFLVEEERDIGDLLIIVLFLIILGILIYLFQKRKPVFEEVGDAELLKLFNFIKKEKRTTQKDIRKQFFQSEAKISLMLSELESKGFIKKLKKGRGNLILFQKKQT